MEQVMTKAKVEAIVGSYLRGALTAVIALYLAGETNVKTLVMAAVAAVAAPALKALDPSAKDFGKGSKPAA
jgi:hypothetical protein